MRRRGKQAATVDPVDETAERRAQAKVRLEGWVRSSGRKIADEAAFRYEIRLSHNDLWRLLEKEDLDELVALARELGPNEQTHAYRRELGIATEFARQNPQLGKELARRFPGLSEEDLRDLRARAQARSEPEAAPA